MSNHPTSQETIADHESANPTSINTRPSARFCCHLPPDILYRIASNLPPKEFARTSVLSTEWRGCMTSVCPRLTFDAAAMCKCEREDLWMHVLQFVGEVSDILQKHHDKVVETLQVKMDFIDTILALHIDSWVDFVVSSRVKNLTLDLMPKRPVSEYKYIYVFPLQLLDRESISRLQHLHLSFVYLDPPFWFKGFPNLRKLHMEMVHVSRKDLENMLSHCYTLEWLCIDRCRLVDALVVDSPLSRLLYLKIYCCRLLTKIKFNAPNLSTFEYMRVGRSFIPIDLSHSFKLQSANIEFGTGSFQHILTSLLNGLTNVQSLTLNISVPHLEKPWSWDNPLEFSNLTHLQLVLFICPEYVDKVLYSVLFLRATPFIEKLDVHFRGSSLWLAEVGPCRKDLIGQCKCNYLKDIWITGFKAARGQLEFLMHVVENAPALEVVLVEIGQYPPYLPGTTGQRIEDVKKIVRSCLSAELPQNVKFDVRE